jgi:hypothetical protein
MQIQHLNFYNSTNSITILKNSNFVEIDPEVYMTGLKLTRESLNLTFLKSLA